MLHIRCLKSGEVDHTNIKYCCVHIQYKRLVYIVMHFYNKEEIKLINMYDKRGGSQRHSTSRRMGTVSQQSAQYSSNSPGLKKRTRLRMQHCPSGYRTCTQYGRYIDGRPHSDRGTRIISGNKGIDTRRRTQRRRICGVRGAEALCDRMLATLTHSHTLPHTDTLKMNLL